MACSKLEGRGHLLHKTGTPPKHFSRECIISDITQKIFFNERETLNSSTIELLLKATAVWLLQAVFPGNIRLQISYVAFSFKTLKH